MQMETIIHHFLAIAALVIALLSGFDMIGVAAGFMLCEISSIFLSFKMMFDVKGKEKKNTCFSVVNQLLFLLTFTAFLVLIGALIAVFPGLHGLHRRSSSHGKRHCFQVA